MGFRRDGHGLVAEATLSNLEPSAIDVLRRLVDQFDGRAELLYRRGEWMFTVHYIPADEAPFESVKLPVEDHHLPSTLSTEGFADNGVEKTSRRALDLAGGA